MGKSKTPVTWLMNELEKQGFVNKPCKDIFDEAVKMEKEVIKEAYRKGGQREFLSSFLGAPRQNVSELMEDYYKDNYKTKKGMVAEKYTKYKGDPNYKEQEFNNSEELLNIDFVKRNAEYTDYGKFYRFSLSRDTKSGISQHLLMAEYSEGSQWIPVAYIRDVDISGIDDLPEFNPKTK